MARTKLVNLNEEQVLLVKRQIAALRDDATVADLSVAAFQSELDACFDKNRNGRVINVERAMQLRAFVPDAKRDAEYKRELADALEILLTGEVPSDHPSRIPHSDRYGYGY